MSFLEGLAGGLLSNGINSIFGLLTHESQSGLMNQSIQAQKNLMKENNRFQSEENQKSRDFTSQMYDRQLKDTQSWNDYSQIVKRALNAGISPSAIFQNGAPAQLGGLTPPSVGHTASPSPSYADVINPPNRSAEAFHSVASALSSLAQASKTGLETTKLGGLLDAQMKNYLSQAGLNDMHVQTQQFELGLRKIYGEKLFDSEIGKNYSQMVQSYYNAVLAAEQGKTEESKRELNLAERLYKDSLRFSTDKQAELVQLEIDWYPKQMRAQIDNLIASSEESRASAQEHRASAALTRWEESFRRSNNDILVSKLDQELRNLEHQGDIMSWQVDAAKATAELQRTAADHAEALFWKDFVKDIVVSGFDAFLGYKNSKSWERLSESSRSRAESRIRELELQYGDSYTDEYSAFDPTGTKHTYKAKYYRGSGSKFGK